MAQWKRAGPITQRSVDRNYALLKHFFLLFHIFIIAYVISRENEIINTFETVGSSYHLNNVILTICIVPKLDYVSDGHRLREPP